VLPGGGFILACGQTWGDGPNSGLFGQSLVTSNDPTFATYTVQAEVYFKPPFGGSGGVDRIGIRCIRPGDDGYIYMTNDTCYGLNPPSVQGYCQLMRITPTKLMSAPAPSDFKLATNTGFLGANFFQTVPAMIGGQPFYDGNVTWDAYHDRYGNPEMRAIYAVSNETTEGAFYPATYPGTFDQFVSQFTFQP
jgi:hypothetical protein